MVLEAVYEQDFLPCSYGFRPGRGAHDALSAVWTETMALGGGWVVEADIEGFFDSVDHAKLREVLSQRVSDGVLIRLIGKWLRAGVMEDGAVRHPETGTPQGGVISPLLANVYLHEVLDVWWERDVRPRMSGRTALVRYADDFVLLFEREKRDARRVEAVLSKRFEVRSEAASRENSARAFPNDPTRGLGRRWGESSSFDLLGFTHYWGKSRRAAGWSSARR